MTRAKLIAIGGALASVAILAAAFAGHRPADPASPRRILYYRDPMHPSYTSSRPGKAPDCGMALEPVYANDVSSRPGSIVVSPEQQQVLGVHLGQVERNSFTRTIRALGRVAPQENRLFPVIASADGWVRRVSGIQTGSVVRKGDPLVWIYGREYMNTQRAFVYALRSLETALRIPSGDYQDTPRFALQEARQNMQNMGFNEAQIEHIASSRQAVLEVELCTPSSGVVLARNAYPQQRFDRGAELFRIADLTEVWIVADLFGAAESIHPGSSARITYPDHPGILGQATVIEALPRFDSDARAEQIRLRFANPALKLKPDMSLNVEFAIPMPVATIVPSDAVIDSGTDKTVFVQTTPGVFEPRSVETGFHFDGKIQILAGLKPGETIVVSGNFLLDSESRTRRGDAGHDQPHH